MTDIHVPRKTAHVLRVLLDTYDPDKSISEARMSGYILGKFARAYGRISSGYVSVILMRLEQAGWVESEWEQLPEGTDPATPRRRYYRLTENGADWAREAVARDDARPPFWKKWSRK